MDSELHPETPVSPFTNKKDVTFASSSCWFRYIGLIDITIARVRALISMTLSQPNMQQRLSTNLAELLLLTAPEAEDDMLEVTDAEATMDLLEEAKFRMKVISDELGWLYIRRKISQP